MEHYRCYTVYVEATHSECMVDTIEFFPTRTKLPQTSSRELVIRAANELTRALRNPHPAMPLAPLSARDNMALQELSDIFNAALLRVGGVKPKNYNMPTTWLRETDSIASRTRRPVTRRFGGS